MRDGPGEARPLENTANNVPLGLPPAAERRLDRWDQRADLWRLSSLQRVRNCGRVPRDGSTTVTLRAGDLGASWAGLQHCGSVWAEPVCAATIRAHRALEVGGVLGAALADGQALTFGTLTPRHHLGLPLTALWDAASTAWKAAAGSESFRKRARRAGVVGWVRVWECTWGRNGWHLHPHWVLAGGEPAEVLDLCEQMFGRWSRSLVRSGLGEPLRRGQEWHTVTGAGAATGLSEYLFKLADAPPVEQAITLGVELTHTVPGRTAAGIGTVPVWALADSVRLDGDADALARWHEWERGSKGRRQIGWGGDLRKFYDQGDEELTDEEVADLERGSSADDLLALTVEEWRALVCIHRGPALVIEGWYRAGLSGARAVLDELGVSYREVV